MYVCMYVCMYVFVCVCQCVCVCVSFCMLKNIYLCIRTHTHTHTHTHTLGDAYQCETEGPEDNNERTWDAEASNAALREEQILKSTPSLVNYYCMV